MFLAIVDGESFFVEVEDKIPILSGRPISLFTVYYIYIEVSGGSSAVRVVWHPTGQRWLVLERHH